jgi:rod shape-determining protein MreB
VAASNGRRESMASCVGYPRDHVAQKLFQGRKAVFGSEAIRKRTSLRFHQPLAKGVIKSEGLDPELASQEFGAARDIVQHAIELVRPRGSGVTYCVIGAPAQATGANKKLIIDAARDLVDLVLLCSEPFAVAYGMDVLDEALVIDIGAGTVDLCRMHGTLPDLEDQITLETAGDHVDQQLHERMKHSCPEAQFNVHMVKAIKERFGTVIDGGEPIEVTLPVEGRPQVFDVTRDVVAACRSIVPPMIGAMNKLIGSFEPDLQERLRDNVLLGGGGSQIVGLDRAIQVAMKELGGGRVARVEEPLYAGCNGALKIAQDLPHEEWQRLS